MRKNIQLSFITILFFLAYSNYAYCDTRQVISYKENFSKQGKMICRGISPKELRADKNAARFIDLIIDAPDSIQKCIYYAVDIWQSRLQSQIPIVIGFSFKQLSNDIETEVYYRDEHKVSIPTALYKHLELSNIADSPILEDMKDGSIHINSNVEWDCSVGENINSEKPNLTFAILRSIAKILGFGSTIIIDESDNLSRSQEFYSKYDNLILTADNKPIVGLNEIELSDYYYSDKGKFYITKYDSLYELEKWPSYGGPVFSYLNDTTSLMSSSPQIGSYYLQIDSLTTNVLKAIGWEIPETPTVNIVCDDADDSGIMSAYTDHKFYVSSDNVNLDSIKSQIWKLSIPLSSGGEEVRNLANNVNSCTIPAIEDPEKYERNVNGDIYAYLDFSFVINGKVYLARKYRITFELMPTIVYAKILKIENSSSQPSFDAYYEVKYLGTDHITVSVEEEYGTWLKTKILREPYIAKGVCMNITAPFRSWIDFKVYNKYGSDIYTIELGPYGETINNPDIIQSGIEEDNCDESPTKTVEVYNLQGALVGIYENLNDAKQSLGKGIFIIREILESGQIKTYKEITK